MADEVQFTDEQWEAVATAAETFAAVLATEQAKLGRVVTSNWAGQCSEGEATIANLQSLLRGEAGSFSQAISAEANYLQDVASRCRESKAALNSVDDAESEKFRR